ncbi:tubulin folding cofactor B [Magnaporthiopsis poae ATCC 64411]|uniref:Tubulin folding cofactor B n=1 Tax=Magnaporthiopsis poae (strain ATCC 64411 / 73-15) TaxID=644358 RepID=A0A0C4CSI6_MAGP6|nr:tubulin folding cofactor B, variant [Magnaporthiopsis poae ATCC 64411]KLU89702.1 tubulin folding cofactor B [Magnaporthiopsis poae ATCC 64411]
MADVPLLVVSDSTSSERRITPSWSISHLKAKLETITGVPPSSQRLSLNVRGQQPVPIEAADEDATTLTGFPLEPYADLIVVDTRPPAARLNLTDATGVEKYVLPEAEYEKKQDSVLAWKKAQKLGRFDPEAPGQAEARAAAHARDAADRGVEPGRRCRVGADDSRRGVVKYVGDVPEIPGGAGFWVGVHLDEPVGKNDGSIGGKRYWGDGPAELKHGVFVRPERVEVGDFPPLNDLADDLDMEEI